MRAFTALPLPAPLREEIDGFLSPFREAGPRVRWVAPGQLHVTLNFLGEVEEGRAPELERALAEAVGSRPPLELRLEEIGGFPELSRAHVLWLAVRPVAPVTALYRAVQEAFASLGLPREEREYHPHVTLGRVRRGNRAPPRLVELCGERRLDEPFSVGRVELVRSRLTSDGPSYTTLAAPTLDGR